MNKLDDNLILGKFDEYPKIRHPHPSIYKKIRKTRKLKEKGEDPKKYKEKGGVGQKTMELLKIKYEIQKELTEKLEKERAQIIKEKGFEHFKELYFMCKNITPLNEKMNALVVLVDFKDKNAVTEPEVFKELLFNDVSPCSMKDYYKEVSGGKFELDGDVSEWYRVKKKYSKYLDYSDKFNSKTLKHKLPKAQELVKEAAKNVKKDKKFDFTKYANANNEIDIFIVIYAGYGFNTTHSVSNQITHQGKLNEPFKIQKDVIIQKYCLVDELPSYDIGGFCHEVAHTLGLLDLYNNQSTVVGRWCLMGCGDYNNDGRTPSHLSAWCKFKLGWAKLENIIKEPKIYKISSQNKPKRVFKLEIKDTEGLEYFLVENRQPIGYDAKLPGNGLLIWHINEKECISEFPNNNPSNLFISLKQADGKNELETSLIQKSKEIKELLKNKEYEGDAGDIFPGEKGNKTFDDNSIPNSKTHSGKRTNIVIKSISDSKDIMTALMGYELNN